MQGTISLRNVVSLIILDKGIDKKNVDLYSQTEKTDNFNLKVSNHKEINNNAKE